MRNLFALATILLAGSSCLWQSDALKLIVKEITPKELSAVLGHVVVIDVNEQENFIEAHVPGVKLMVFDATKPEDLPADKSTTLVSYCWSPECPAAEKAAETAAALGHTDVRWMKEGITGWQDTGLPTGH